MPPHTAPSSVEDLGLYLQDFVASLDNLPSEVLHLLIELRTKEEAHQAIRRRIGQREANLVALYRTHTYKPTGRHAQREKAFISEVEEGFEEMRRIADEKILITGRIVSLIQKYTRKLDADLAAFVEDPDLFPSTISHVDELSGSPRPPSGSGSGSGEGTGHGQTRGHKRSQRTSIVVQNTVTNQPEVIEEELTDANGEETRYCFCRGLSYGDMVGCDNGENCPYEWFHYECVGLKEPPKGQWYCSLCLDKVKKSKKAR